MRSPTRRGGAGASGSIPAKRVGTHLVTTVFVADHDLCRLVRTVNDRGRPHLGRAALRLNQHPSGARIGRLEECPRRDRGPAPATGYCAVGRAAASRTKLPSVAGDGSDWWQRNSATSCVNGCNNQLPKEVWEHYVNGLVHATRTTLRKKYERHRRTSEK